VAGSPSYCRPPVDSAICRSTCTGIIPIGTGEELDGIAIFLTNIPDFDHHVVQAIEGDGIIPIGQNDYSPDILGIGVSFQLLVGGQVSKGVWVKPT